MDAYLPTVRRDLPLPSLAEHSCLAAHRAALHGRTAVRTARRAH